MPVLRQRTKAEALEALRGEENACREHARAHGLNYVFGSGSAEARVLFIGEAPGRQEDKKGEPFVGRAGKLLDTLLERAGFAREEVYITNVVKFRPLRDPARPDTPGNDRPPRKNEISLCLGVLERQIEIIRPAVICALGNTPLRALLGTGKGVTELHGKAGEYRGIPVIATFHPAAVLRNPLLTEVMLRDLRLINRELW